MMPSSQRFGSCGLLLVGLLSACGVDSRALSYEFHALDGEGASAIGGSVSTGSSSAEDPSGDSAAGEGGAPDQSGTSSPSKSGSATGGTSSSGGATANGSNGGATVGETPGDAGATSGGAPVVETAGSGGSAAGGRCVDLNEDGVDDCSQTLVKNSRFDANSDGWTAETLLTATWDARDASGNAGSGSLLLSNTASVAQGPGSLMVGAHQCIPTAPGTTYDVAAQIMIAAGQADGAGGIDVTMYDDDACQANVVSAHTPFWGGSLGQWTTLKGSVWVPGGVHSLLVRLVAIKPFTETELKVLIDDVLFAKH